jgi:hypothetical protein
MRIVPCQLGGFVTRRPGLTPGVGVRALLRAWLIYLAVLAGLAAVSAAFHATPMQDPDIAAAPAVHGKFGH